MNQKTITEIKRLLTKEEEEKEKAVREYAKQMIEKYGENFKEKYNEEECIIFGYLLEELTEITKVKADYCDYCGVSFM